MATAITGIAIGVCMALFAQGHSQAFRGQEARIASQIGVRLIQGWKARKKFPSFETGQIENFPGWTYYVESAPVSAKIALPGGDTRTIEADELTQITLKMVPPSKKRDFVLTFWIPSTETEEP